MSARKALFLVGYVAFGFAILFPPKDNLGPTRWELVFEHGPILWGGWIMQVAVVLGFIILVYWMTEPDTS